MIEKKISIEITLAEASIIIDSLSYGKKAIEEEKITDNDSFLLDFKKTVIECIDKLISNLKDKCK